MAEDHWRIDADFPGGNVVIERTEGAAAFLRQDLRDTEGHWFYWCFRVRGAAGRTLTFHMLDRNLIGVRGPAVSADGGRTWAWLGASGTDAFQYAFPRGADDVRFAMGVPYVQSDLDRFLARHRGSPFLRAEALCRSRGGRDVELLLLGHAGRTPACRVLLTCRHHACEAMASYVLEGLMDAVLAEDEPGAWLRRNADIRVVPFVDKDGVERGDQGKNRRPHDHNRDYGEEGIYPEVRAIKALVEGWGAAGLDAVFDLHCPWLHGRYNEWIYFVGSRDPDNWRRTQAFADVLERTAKGPLPYRAEDNLPFGKEWNTGEGLGRGCASWLCARPEVALAAAIETPYANARGAEVTPRTARAFGRDLAHALRRYLDGDREGSRA